jgi:hypothetical protein
VADHPLSSFTKSMSKSSTFVTTGPIAKITLSTPGRTKGFAHLRSLSELNRLRSSSRSRSFIVLLLPRQPPILRQLRHLAWKVGEERFSLIT